MIRKRILSLVTAIGIVLPSILTAPVTMAEDSLTKEVYVNVAQFKPVIAAMTDYADYPRTNVVDGRNGTYGGCYYLTDNTGFYVDLGHRYNIERIEVEKFNYIQGHAFIEVANKTDFSDGIRIGKITNDECEPFVMDGKKAYRYVRFVGNPNCTLSELRVFAKQTITEVSRNKPVVANSENSYETIVYSASKAVNGTNNDINDSWVSNGAGNNYWVVDLEEALPIGYIEMQGRNHGGADDDRFTHLDKGIYGSNVPTADNVIAYTTEGKITDTAVATRLAYITQEYEYVTFPYPKYDASDAGNTTYKTSVDDSTPFRYIVYKNERSDKTSAIGEFKAYVINPRITEASVKDGKATVLFSDVMNAATVTADTLNVTDASTGNKVIVSNLAIDGYTMTFDLPYNSDFNISLTDEAKNTNGISAANNSLTVEAEDIYSGLPTYTKSYNVAQNKPVTISTGSVVEGAAQNVVDEDFDTYACPGYDEVNHSYTVDLQRRYKIEKIALATRKGYSIGLDSFEIQVSNDADANYKTIDSSENKSLTAAGNTHDYFNGTNGEAYRYVRVLYKEKMSSLAEIKVYAQDTMTEVSREKEVKGNDYSNNYAYELSSLVNGTIANWQVWYGGEDNYPFARIDLGKAYPVGAIEIYAERADKARKYFNIYGHNNDDLAGMTDEEIANLQMKAPNELYNTSDYAKLTGLTDNAVSADGEYTFPAAGKWSFDGKSYLASTDDTTQFRYITYKKSLAGLSTLLDEMRVMVINPVVHSASYEEGKVTVAFNDTMSVASITADKFAVTAADGSALEISNITMPDKYTAVLEVRNAPEIGVGAVTVQKSVRNTKGVTMASANSSSISFGEGINASIVFDKTALVGKETLTATASLVSSLTDSEDIDVIIALKDIQTEELKGINITHLEIGAGAEASPTVSIVIPEDVTNIKAEAYVWIDGTLEPLCDKLELPNSAE